MVILTNKGPDLAAPTAVSWEGRWSPTEIVESNTKHNAWVERIGSDFKRKYQTGLSTTIF